MKKTTILKILASILILILLGLYYIGKISLLVSSVLSSIILLIVFIYIKPHEKD